MELIFDCISLPVNVFYLEHCHLSYITSGQSTVVRSGSFFVTLLLDPPTITNFDSLSPLSDLIPFVPHRINSRGLETCVFSVLNNDGLKGVTNDRDLTG